MLDTRRRSKLHGGGSDIESEAARPNVGDVKANGLVFDIENGSSGLGVSGLLTYKRRRNAKVAERGKSIMHLYNQAACSQKGSHDLTFSSDDCPLKHQRDIILHQICQSLDSECGLKKCIQNALESYPESGSRTTLKESVHSCEVWSKCTSWNGTLHNGLKNAAKGSVCMTSSGSDSESKHHTFTELCKFTFSDILKSEKFAKLCSLLLENFQGVKTEKLFDLNHVNSRMKEGAYESSPMLFQSDILEVWKKLQKVGTDITALAKCLSDETVTSFLKQFFAQQSDMHHKSEPTETDALNRAHTCRRCQKQADGRNGLVCDSCEGMYHVSCIEPALKEIPTGCWYCSNCNAKESESSHDNCIACERLNSVRSPFEGRRQDEFVHDEAAEELEESPNELVANEGAKRFAYCKTCGTVVRQDEEYRVCGHSFCSHKFYHVKCLTSRQLISYGPCWYCPSCLCGACFTDRDDDNIVLCDGCDHAYHIYCMLPPRSTIPKGKWFCQTCNSGIQRLRKARRSYENMQNVSRKRSSDGKFLNRPGGEDMLLNAANTLNYEGNLVASGLKTKGADTGAFWRGRS